MNRTLLAAGMAVAVGLPTGWILAFMATPLLWQLEPVLKMELAGHSGPSDRVFYVVWAIVIPALFFGFLSIMRQTPSRRSAVPSRDGGPG